jgi:dTDP-4-amino-4,6-dideoxygalactose transaminase
MVTLKNRIESFLKEKHQRSHVVLFGSGTAALIAILRILISKKNGTVAIPVNVCPNVVTAIYAAGKIPLYLDIEEETCGVWPEELERIEEKPDALIAVHSYGIPCQIEKLQQICNERGIYLIEDAALALGATIGSRPVCSYGIASILSFGSGKIISAGGNGAVLTDDATLAKSLYAEVRSYGVGDKMIVEALSKLHTFSYNSFQVEHIKKLSFIFRTLAKRDPNVWLNAFDENLAENLYDKLILLERNVEKRKRMAERYTEIFKQTELQILATLKGSVCWRFNLFIPQHRDYILKTMLSQGYLVSSWYPPIAPYFEESIVREWAIAERQGSQILNLWVNDEVDEEKIEKSANKVIHIYESMNN